MFGDHTGSNGVVNSFNEASDFRPMSPYAVSKVSAFHVCGYFKRVFNLQVATAISFNHESPLRGEQFVT
jgi:GDPmannose 4,6-dehydratase